MRARVVLAAAALGAAALAAACDTVSQAAVAAGGGGGATHVETVQVVPLGGGTAVVKGFGNPGASIGRIGGVPVFASQDDRFSYLYTSYAASVRPLQLWRLRLDASST